MRAWICCAFLVFLAACDQEPVTKGQLASWDGSVGRLVINGKRLEAAQFTHQAGASADDGTMSIVPIADMTFDRALRLETLRQPSALDSLEASLMTEHPIDAGSSCWLHLQARAAQPQTETGLARLLIGFQSAESRQRPPLEHEIYVEPTWTSIDIPFSIRSDFDEGEAKVVFGVGTQLQIVDIGNIALRCFDPENLPTSLPTTAFTYAGRAEDAPWREVAEGRIDRYRRSDVAIKVVDADDQPVPDAEIHVLMTRHSFKFGAAIDAELLAGASPGGGPGQYDEEDTTRYRKVLQELFNTATFENGLSWTAWSDDAQRRVTEDALAWVKSLDLELRGSSLVPGDWSDLPLDLQNKSEDPNLVRAAVIERIRTMVGDLDGQVEAWDVTDRPDGRHDLAALLGAEELDEWFRQARAAAPQSRLYLNEDDVLAGDGLVQLVSILDQLTDRQVPIDAIGIKGHFNEQPPSIQILSDRLDQLASFELPMMITEFDMETSDPALHADFTRDLMTLAFSHPSVEGFVFWGFWEGRQSIPGAAMYDENWTTKPVGEIYRDLVLGRWWTDDVALTNVDGELLTRGFLGDYVITARKNDLSATTTLNLGRDGISIKLKLAKATSG